MKRIKHRCWIRCSENVTVNRQYFKNTAFWHGFCCVNMIWSAGNQGICLKLEQAVTIVPPSSVPTIQDSNLVQHHRKIIIKHPSGLIQIYHDMSIWKKWSTLWYWLTVHYWTWPSLNRLDTLVMSEFAIEHGHRHSGFAHRTRWILP